MISTAITDLWYGFGVALEPHNLMYCFLGVLVGNLVGVLPGMGPVATISILLPLTFGMQPVPAILMLSGVYYGAQYGGAICSILLNLPCHPPHAVTCLDGFPLTKQGKGGTALGITIIAAFVGASFGITEMIFLAPFLVKVALEFGPAEVCSLMLVGLLAGSTLAKGSPLKGIAMTVLGLLIGIVGSDIETGQPRFTFGITELFDGVEIIALALGMFGIAEFMNSINNTETVDMKYAKVGISDMFPSKADLKLAFWPMIRGTVLGSLCALIPGHRTDHRLVRVLRHREEDLEDAGAFRPRRDRGRRMPRGLDALLGAGRLHPDHEPRHSRRYRDGAAARRADHSRHRSRPAAHQPARRHLLGPDRELLDRQYPAGHSQRADDRPVGEAARAFPTATSIRARCSSSASGSMPPTTTCSRSARPCSSALIGYILLRLDFHPAPILLGFVLGPRFEENFRRSLLISRGDLMTFIDRPISAFFLLICVVLIVAQIYVWLRKPKIIAEEQAIEAQVPATSYSELAG